MSHSRSWRMLSCECVFAVWLIIPLYRIWEGVTLTREKTECAICAGERGDLPSDIHMLVLYVHF